jgi:hypothetical protein
MTVLKEGSKYLRRSSAERSFEKPRLSRLQARFHAVSLLELTPEPLGKCPLRHNI